jgi:DNA processing protein
MIMALVTVTQALLHVISQSANVWIPPLSHEILNDELMRTVEAKSLEQAFEVAHMHITQIGVRSLSHEVMAASKRRWFFFLQKHLEAVNYEKGRYITYNHPLYPPLLRAIADPPLALTVLGNSSVLQARMFAIIGSRKASTFALDETYDLARYVGRSGIVIVSGGAFGCDIEAHKGALDSEVIPVPTVIVSAGGLAELYPKGNETIFRQILGRGGVAISERLWWTRPQRYDFPVRNRIISGMSERVFIMQAHQESGAKVTAQLGLDQGRDIWVLAHDAGDIRAAGGEQLINDGATSFVNFRDCVQKISRVNPDVFSCQGVKPIVNTNLSSAPRDRS